jgi:hypothetical protein
MVHAGVDERLLDAVAVDRDRGLVRVLLENGEQVAEQPLLGGGELDVLDLGVRVRVSDAINRRPSDQAGLGALPAVRGARLTGSAVSALTGTVPPAGQRAAQSLRGRFGLLRNRRPSSSRWA